MTSRLGTGKPLTFFYSVSLERKYDEDCRYSTTVYYFYFTTEKMWTVDNANLEVKHTLYYTWNAGRSESVAMYKGSGCD